MQGTPEVEESPVIVGQEASQTQADVLVNLCEDPSPEAEQYPRVAEIIAQDDGSKTAGRARFRQYRERGFELKTHEIAA
jgi:DNA polymerase-3 subunit chi